MNERKNVDEAIFVQIQAKLYQEDLLRMNQMTLPSRHMIRDTLHLFYMHGPAF